MLLHDFLGNPWESEDSNPHPFLTTFFAVLQLKCSWCGLIRLQCNTVHVLSAANSEDECNDAAKMLRITWAGALFSTINFIVSDSYFPVTRQLSAVVKQSPQASVEACGQSTSFNNIGLWAIFATNNWKIALSVPTVETKH